jgi:L-alanine-DL-glutamate epimerase-like enolase superfamily enzyme
VRDDAADFLQPDVWKVGGVSEYLKIMALGGAANIDISPHACMELSVHLACAVPNALHVENIFGLNLYDFGATAEPLPVRDGRLSPTDTPGHGVVFDGPSLTAANEIQPGQAIDREPLQRREA